MTSLATGNESFLGLPFIIQVRQGTQPGEKVVLKGKGKKFSILKHPFKESSIYLSSKGWLLTDKQHLQKMQVSKQETLRFSGTSTSTSTSEFQRMTYKILAIL